MWIWVFIRCAQHASTGCTVKHFVKNGCGCKYFERKTSPVKQINERNSCYTSRWRRRLWRAFCRLRWIICRSWSITLRIFCAYRSFTLCLFLAMTCQLDRSNSTNEAATMIGNVAEMIRDVDRVGFCVGVGFVFKAGLAFDLGFDAGVGFETPRLPPRGIVFQPPTIYTWNSVMPYFFLANFLFINLYSCRFVVWFWESFEPWLVNPFIGACCLQNTPVVCSLTD